MNINAAQAIPPEQLPTALSTILLEWADNQEKIFFEAIDEAGEACIKKIEEGLWQGHGVNTGNYRKSFRLASEQPEKHHKYVTWYAEAPHYRLTHLLENGHLTRDGMRRTKPVKHIKYGRQIAEQVLEERLAGLWGE